MRDTVLNSLYEQDLFTALETLGKQPDPLVAARAYAEIVHPLYWQRKDLPRTLAMAQAGIQFGV